MTPKDLNTLYKLGVREAHITKEAHESLCASIGQGSWTQVEPIDGLGTCCGVTLFLVDEVEAV